MNKKHFFYSLPIIFLMITVAAGWFATDYLGNKARQEIIAESRASLLSVSTHVSSTLTNIEGAVRSLAGSPWIAPALISKRDRDIEHANGVLDRYNSALNASVSYLMDAGGMTVASSNRKDPDSFVGKSYLFRPYFQEAAGGLAGRYFALGVTSGKRGFYASHPVKDPSGKVLGVVTMKKDLDDMEGFFKRYPFCFLINPDGIIFLSSSSAMVMKSLYPLDKAVQEQLIASRQFGNKPFETVFLKKDFADGTEVTLEGKDYFVSRDVIDNDGWSIVLLTPTDHIRVYKLTGILAMISVCFLIMIFSGIIYFTNRSRETIRRSEEDKRLLLDAAGEGIFGVDAAGLVTLVNPAALRMLGFAEEEALGQNAHDLIHHSREDGSSYPAEDCPIYASYARAVDSYVTEEVLWRKDGSSFPVEYSSMPITRDGTVMGAVVTFKDITNRRKTEKALQENESLQRILLANLPAGVVIIDPATRTIERVNNTAAAMFGVPAEHIVGHRCHAFLCPAIEGDCPVCDQGKEIDNEEREMVCADGSRRPVLKSVKRVKIQGQEKLLECFVDITDRKLAEKALSDSEERFRKITTSARDAIIMMDSRGAITYWNEAAERIFGHTPGEAMGKELHAFLVPQKYYQASLKGLSHFVKTGEGDAVGKTLELLALRKDGAEFPIELSLSAVHLQNGWSAIGILRDITGRKELEQQLQTMSLTDELTGLYNRRGFITLSEQQLKMAVRTKKDMLLFFVDLDKMKQINDTLGHKEGDKALAETANILKEVFRGSDIIGRMGGDEFAILAIDTADGTGEVLIHRLHNTLADHNRAEGRNYALSLSMGMAHYDPERPCSLDELIALADASMYEEKRNKQH